jgi:hypothetical protein
LRLSAGSISDTEITEVFQQVELARLCVLFFISRASDMPGVAPVWHSSVQLTPAVFSLMFELGLRPIIVSVFPKIWRFSECELGFVSETCFKMLIVHEDYSQLLALLYALTGALAARHNSAGLCR